MLVILSDLDIFWWIYGIRWIQGRKYMYRIKIIWTGNFPDDPRRTELR